MKSHLGLTALTIKVLVPISSNTVIHILSSSPVTVICTCPETCTMLHSGVATGGLGPPKIPGTYALCIFRLCFDQISLLLRILHRLLCLLSRLNFNKTYRTVYCNTCKRSGKSLQHITGYII